MKTQNNHNASGFRLCYCGFHKSTRIGPLKRVRKDSPPGSGLQKSPETPGPSDGSIFGWFMKVARFMKIKK